MKHCSLLAMLFLCATVHAEFLDERYTPTREEWLQLYLDNRHQSIEGCGGGIIVYADRIEAHCTVHNLKEVENKSRQIDIYASLIRRDVNKYEWARDIPIIGEAYSVQDGKKTVFYTTKR